MNEWKEEMKEDNEVKINYVKKEINDELMKSLRNGN